MGRGYLSVLPPSFSALNSAIEHILLATTDTL